MLEIRRNRSRRATGALLSTFVLVALTLLVLPDFVSRFRSALTPFFGDALLNLVFLEWGSHQIGLGLPDYWDANFFFPARMTMALSDHLIGLAALRFLLARAGAGPVASYNLLLFASFVATGAATLWLARRAGLSRPAALFAASAYVFSQFRLMHVGHLQILWAPFLPLALGTFDRLLERPSPRRALAFFACYAFHLTGGSYLAYMIHFPLIAIAVARWRPVVGHVVAPLIGNAVARSPLSSTPRRFARAAILGALAVACLGVAWLAFAPYGRAAKLHDLKRPADYLRGFGATAASFVTPDSKSRFAPLLFDPGARPESSLFPGFAVGGLLLVALGRSLSTRLRRATPGQRWLFVTGVLLIAIALALGDYRSWTAVDRFELGALSFSIRKYTVPFRLLLVGAALVSFALATRRQKEASPASELRRSLFFSSLFALLLCFPLVYIPLARWVPGLDAMRVPTRFFAFASLGLAVGAGAELDRWRRRVTPSQRRLAVPLALGLLALESAPATPQWASLARPEQFGAVDRWIGETERVRAIVELPLPGPENCELDTLRVYHASVHWKPIVNGCSGHFPEEYERLRSELSNPPLPADLERLRALGVTHLLLRDLSRVPHPRSHERFAIWARRSVADGLGAVVYDDGEAIVFALDSAEGGAEPESAGRSGQRRRRASAR